MPQNGVQVTWVAPGDSPVICLFSLGKPTARLSGELSALAWRTLSFPFSLLGRSGVQASPLPSVGKALDIALVKVLLL